MSATNAYEAALQLEKSGRNGDLDGVGEAFLELKERVHLLKQDVSKLHSELTT
ncbi:MAG: hypothetical protein ACKVII_28105 [Planctomycetales bacterium]